MKQNQKGRSLIEVLGVLALSAVAINSAIRIYQKNAVKVKVNKTMYNISELTDLIKTIYWGRSDFSDIATKVSEGNLEVKYLRDGFGNSFEVEPVNGGTEYLIRVSYLNDSKTCYTLAEKDMEGLVSTTNTCTDNTNKTVTFTFK